MTALTSLVLCSCEIDDTSLYQLHEVPLQALKIWTCSKISNAGIASLVAGMPLTRLNIYNIWKVNDGVLPSLYGLPLVELHVTGGGFSEKALDELIQAVPSIEKVHFFTGHPSYMEKILHGQASGRSLLDVAVE